jgi:hypothetical protein
MLHLTLDDDRFIDLPGIDPEELSAEASKSLADLCEVRRRRDGTPTVRRRINRIGRIALPSVTIDVPPPVDPRSFAAFYLYALGHDLKGYLEREPAPEHLERTRDDPAYLGLLANLLVRSATTILAKHVAQRYERTVERPAALRGRPRFGADFGRHPAEGRTCEFFEKTTDTLMNRLVLAGLEVATPLLAGTASERAATTQLFAWRSLAIPYFPAPHDFELAAIKTDRLTTHYRLPLALARALLFGATPQPVDRRPRYQMQTLFFDMPRLFELFVTRLLSEAAPSLGLVVRGQYRVQRALVDGAGKHYRTVRPDVVMSSMAGTPLAVLDVKYKPRYLQRGRGKLALVSAADTYQMFFYEARVRRRHRLPAPLPLAIIAPQLEAELPDDRFLRIRWAEVGESMELSLVPVPLADVAIAIADGKGAAAALGMATHLRQFVTSAIGAAASGAPT